MSKFDINAKNEDSVSHNKKYFYFITLFKKMIRSSLYFTKSYIFFLYKRSKHHFTFFILHLHKIGIDLTFPFQYIYTYML
jgi:hypothetical protein